MVSALATAGALCAAAPSHERWDGHTTVGQPSRYPFIPGPNRVTGYRSATFGMTEQEVRAAVVSDFGAAAAGLHQVKAEEGVTALALTAPALRITGVGAATVTYRFTNGRLCGVNLFWKTAGEGTPASRAALAAHSAEVTRGLLGRHWKLLATLAGKPLGPNALLVFAGADELGNGVEVALFNIDYTLRLADGTDRASSPAKGPAGLRVAYTVDIDHRFDLHLGDF